MVGGNTRNTRNMARTEKRAEKANVGRCRQKMPGRLAHFTEIIFLIFQDRNCSFLTRFSPPPSSHHLQNKIAHKLFGFLPSHRSFSCEHTGSQKEAIKRVAVATWKWEENCFFMETIQAKFMAFCHNLLNSQNKQFLHSSPCSTIAAAADVLSATMP